MPYASPAFRPALLRIAEHAPAWTAAVLIVSVALLAWSAQLSLPIQPVPITLQSYAVITLAALLGWRLGGIAVLVYVALGAFGLNVFSGGKSGMAVLAGPAGGFLVGFIVVAILVGALNELWAQGRILPLLVTLALGHVVLMAFGAAWMAYLRGMSFAIEKGTLPFLPGAAAKTVAALLTVLLVERLAGNRPAR